MSGSGPYIPEHKRHTEQVKLRLDPDLAARFRGIALAWKCTMGEVLEAALDALESKGRQADR